MVESLLGWRYLQFPRVMNSYIRKTHTHMLRNNNDTDQKNLRKSREDVVATEAVTPPPKQIS